MNAKEWAAPSATHSDTGVSGAARLSGCSEALGQVTRRYQPDFHRHGRSSPIRLIG
jgi:hypothetical protein